MDWSIRAGRRGDGGRCKPLWVPWLGSRYDEVMDSVDGRGQQLTVDNRLFLAEHPRGKVAGMVLTTPPMSLMVKRYGPRVAAMKADEAYTGAVKLAAVAVAPDLRGQGLGAQLVQHAINESVATATWMYGQFETGRNLESFYRRLGFSVDPPNRPLTGPYGCWFSAKPGEQWFERDLLL